MKERPIIFSTPMVRAILDGRKTQTRRVVKLQPEWEYPGNYQRRGTASQPRPGRWCITVGFGAANESRMIGSCPYGQPGDLLWVREAFTEMLGVPYYRADAVLDDSGERDGWWIDDGEGNEAFVPGKITWRSPIHMPKWAARLWLRIVDVRVQRVQDITATECFREGAEPGRAAQLTALDPFHASILAYQALWDSLNARRGYPWESNPWVFVVTFEREEAPA